MRGRVAIWLVALAITATACGDEIIDSGGDRRPGPTTNTLAPTPLDVGAGSGIEAAPVEFADEPISLTVAGTEYWLGVDTEGCVTLLAQVDNTLYTPTRRCEGALQGFWEDTVDCAFRPEADNEGSGNPNALSVAVAPCAVQMPRVVVGHQLGSPDLLCLASQSESGFGPVRFVEPNGDNLWLAAVPPGSHGFVPLAYTADGRRHGDAPIDGAASALYAMCEAAGPWLGEPPPEVGLDVVLRFRNKLRQETGGLYFDFGKGPEWTEFRTGKLVFIKATTFADTSEVAISLFRELGDPSPLATYPYPAAIVAELTSGWACPDAPTLLVDVRRGVLDGNPDAISLSALTPAEVAELEGREPPPATDRAPGQPCPESGAQREGAERPATTGHLVETIIVWDLDPSWLTLGDRWSVAVWHQISASDNLGFVADMAFLADHPEERQGPGGFMAVGNTILVGLVPSLGDGGPDHPGLIALEVPALPVGPLATFEGLAILDLVIGPGDLESRRFDPGAVRLEWRTAD